MGNRILIETIGALLLLLTWTFVCLLWYWGIREAALIVFAIEAFVVFFIGVAKVTG